MSTDIAPATTRLSVGIARMIRERLGGEDITKAELARRLGEDESWIGKRLKGQIKLTVDDFERIAEALDVEPVDLIPRDRRSVTVTQVERPVTRPPNRPHGGRPVNYSGASGPGRTSRTSG